MHLQPLALASRQTLSQSAKSNARKKFSRSTSPRAVERRRLQNKIAQRNHRRKLKESKSAAAGSQPASQTCAADPVDSCLGTEASHALEVPSTENLIPSLEDSIASGVLLADNSTSEHNVDSTQTSLAMFNPAMMHMGEGPTMSNPFPYSIYTCNSTTGPCIEEIQRHFLPSTQPSPRTPLSQIQTTPPHPALPTPPQSLRNGSVGSDTKIDLTSLHRPDRPEIITSCNHSAPSIHRLPSSFTTASSQTQRSSSLVSNTGILHCTSTSPSETRAVDSVQAVQTPETSLSMPEATGSAQGASIHNDRWRFTRILEAVREAGFSDFESMVAAYYMQIPS